jgi:hypothetical protein
LPCTRTGRCSTRYYSLHAQMPALQCSQFLTYDSSHTIPRKVIKYSARKGFCAINLMTLFSKLDFFHKNKILVKGSRSTSFCAIYYGWYTALTLVGAFTVRTGMSCPSIGGCFHLLNWNMYTFMYLYLYFLALASKIFLYLFLTVWTPANRSCCVS